MNLFDPSMVPYGPKPGIGLSGSQALAQLAPTLVVAGFALLIALAMAARKPDRDSRWPWIAALAGLGLSLLLQATGLASLQPGAVRLFQGTLIVDGWGLLAQTLVTSVAFLAVLIRTGLPGNGESGEGMDPDGSVLILVSVVGMQLSVVAADILILLLCLEVGSLPLTWLSAAGKEGRGQGLRAYTSDIISTGLLIWACVLLLAATATTNLEFLARDLPTAATSPLVAVSVVLLVCGLAWKAGAPPLDLGGPTSSAQASAPTALIIEAALRAAAVAAGFRVLVWGFGHDHLSFGPSGWCSLLSVLAAAAMVIGSTAVFWQRRLTDLSSHLTVAHIGWVLAAAAAAGLAGPKDQTGPTAIAFALFTHGIGLAGFLAIAWWIEKDETALPGDELGLPPVWRSFVRKRPAIALALLILLGSLMGLPPTAGFFARIRLLEALLSQQSMIPLALLAVLCWAAATVPMIRIVAALFTTQPAKVPATAGDQPDIPDSLPSPAIDDAEDDSPEDENGAARPGRKEPDKKPAGNTLYGGIILLMAGLTLLGGLLPDGFWAAIQRLLTR